MKDKLDYEHSYFKIQDDFYSKIGAKVERFDYDSLDGVKYQRDDIDGFLTFKNSDKKINISEKNRWSCYDDILIELYSVYEKDIKGWSFTGKSDLICYFVDGRYKKYVGIFNTRDIQKIINENNVLEQVDKKEIESLIHSSSKRKDIKLTFDGESVDCSLIKAENETRYAGRTYNTISVCIPFDVLTKLKASYCIYDFNGKVLKRVTNGESSNR